MPDEKLPDPAQVMRYTHRRFPSRRRADLKNRLLAAGVWVEVYKKMQTWEKQRRAAGDRNATFNAWQLLDYRWPPSRTKAITEGLADPGAPPMSGAPPFSVSKPVLKSVQRVGKQGEDGKWKSELVPTGKPKQTAVQKEGEPYRPLLAPDVQPPDPELIDQDDSQVALAAEKPWVEDSPNSGTLADDILWVYRNLSAHLSPEDCPHGGCWSLWQWAKNNRQHFFQTLLPKALASKESGEEQDVLREEEMAIEEIEELFKELVP